MVTTSAPSSVVKAPCPRPARAVMSMVLPWLQPCPREARANGSQCVGRAACRKATPKPVATMVRNRAPLIEIPRRRLAAAPKWGLDQGVARGRSQGGMTHAGHDHAHHHRPTRFGRAFAIGIALNVAYVAAEAGFGIKANSLALIADAGHNFSDV